MLHDLISYTKRTVFGQRGVKMWVSSRSRNRPEDLVVRKTDLTPWERCTSFVEQVRARSNMAAFSEIYGQGGWLKKFSWTTCWPAHLYCARSDYK